jgi:hypothetical protein
VGWVFCGGNLVVFYNFSASEIFPVRGVSFDGSGLIRGVSFDGSGLIRGVSFDGSGLRRGVSFDGSGLIRGVSFDGSGLIRGVSFDGSGLIRGELLYIIFRISKANHVKISIIQFDYLITRTTAI